MNPRRYRSAVREAAAGATRARIVAAASSLLGARKASLGFSLDAVARKARVTRLTVYKRFGSRRALLEEVFDDMAARGGLHRLHQAMADPDPHHALCRVVAIFCDFWNVDPAALVRLHAAGASDVEFADGVRARNERRRHLLVQLVCRMARGDPPRAKSVSQLVDTLFALTSFGFFAELTSGACEADAACRLIQNLCEDAVQRARLRD
jgi:AcrR family transcriptional regulator